MLPARLREQAGIFDIGYLILDFYDLEFDDYPAGYLILDADSI